MTAVRVRALRLAVLGMNEKDSEEEQGHGAIGTGASSLRPSHSKLGRLKIIQMI